MGFFKNTDTVPDPYANPVDRKRIFLVIGLIGAILIGVFIVLSTVLGSGSKGEFTTLIAKTQSLHKTADESQKRIRNRELAKINSDFTLLLSTDSNAMMGQLQKKFGDKQLSEDSKKQAVDATLAKKLTDAELLNRFDIAYQNIMRQKIGELLASAQKARKDVGGKEFMAVMDTFISNLKTINTQLEKLNLL